MTQYNEVNKPNTCSIHCTCSKCCGYVKPITWSAVVSGAMLAFGLTFLFNLLTLGIGLAIVADNDEGVRSLVFGGFIWTLIGGSIILFFAGLKTGKLINFYTDHNAACNVNQPTGPVAYKKSCYHSMTHGFLAWALYLIISLLFTLFITHITTFSPLRSSFLNVPLGIPQAIAESASADNQNVDQRRMDRQANQRQEAVPISERTAEKASAEVIGIFLIFAFGAAAMSIGSHLGFLWCRKCAEKKQYNP